MQESLRDMVRWSIGFCIVSTIYLVVATYLVRRFQKRRAARKAAADASHAATPPSR
jgi:hypothetical protein